jgi:hypothetical protein
VQRAVAVDYRVYLLDGFDWGYVDTNVEKQLAACLSVANVEVATHPYYGLIIFECRNDPAGTLHELESKGIIWDHCYVQQLPDTALQQFKYEIVRSKRGTKR